MKSCKHCGQSGIYICYMGIQTEATTGNIPSSYKEVPCKFCNGKGWIDEDELLTVPRKYVKDEYFDRKGYA